MGEKREGFSGTTIKDTWTKPRWDGISGVRWDWLGYGVNADNCTSTTLKLKK